VNVNIPILMLVVSTAAIPLAQTPGQTPSQSPGQPSGQNPGQPSAQTPRSSSPAPAPSAQSTKTANGAKGSAAAAAFLKDAADGGMAEVQLAEIAASKAQRDDVKALAKMIKEDHEQANQELKSLASSKQVTLPSAISATKKATVAKFENLSGAAFDRAYIADMVKDHRTDIAKFKKHTSDADADVAAFVTKTLPALEKHLAAAEKAQASAGESATRSTGNSSGNSSGSGGRSGGNAGASSSGSGNGGNSGSSGSGNGAGNSGSNNNPNGAGR